MTLYTLHANTNRSSKDSFKCSNNLTEIFVTSVPDFCKSNLFSCYQKDYYKMLYFGILSGINSFKIEGRNSKF